MVIKDIEDLCEYFGSDVRHIERDIYKCTACGAWIEWDNYTVTIGSIVEGSEAEFSKTFRFQFSSADLDSWLDELDELTDEAWHEANDYEEEEDER